MFNCLPLNILVSTIVLTTLLFHSALFIAHSLICYLFLVYSSTIAAKMSKTTKLPDEVDFQQVKTLQNNALIIDVREPKELKEFGVLPNSINIPLGHVEGAFKELSNEEFKAKFGCSKPETCDGMVFSCKAGIRSKKAMKIVESLGYTNTSNYLGGFDDWLEQNKKS